MKYCNLDYYKQCRVEFGTYANIMDERSQGAIYLGPTTNLKRICKFISLRAGQIITMNQFTPLHMPKYVIKQVEDTFIKEYYDKYLIFTDRNGRTLEVCNDDVNTNDSTSGVDNNYNNYNSNNTTYEGGTNKKEYGTTYKYGTGANTTHEDGTDYTKNPP